MKTNKTIKKGFSIGEVMVAMFILIFGIVSAVFLTSQSVTQIGSSRNATIATLLAQEGTELVKNVRDNTVTQSDCGDGDKRCTAFDSGSGYGWPSSVGEGEGAKFKCTVDYGGDISNEILKCGGDASIEQLYINKSTYFYSHTPGGGVVSPFKRRIYIKYNVGTETDETTVDVASVVIWSKGVFPANIDSVESKCKIGNDCAFAKTILTSWINYGE